MTLTRDAIQPRSLTVPREDGGVLADPPIAELPALVARNLHLRGEPEGSRFAMQAAGIADRLDYDVQGRSFGALIRQARRELLALAIDYTSSYRDVRIGPVGASQDAMPFFLAGHQPELFHPGVWCKNAAISQLASEHQGVAINLLIDADPVRSTSLRVPGGSVARPHIEHVAMDAARDALPYEEFPIADRALFESFGARAAEVIAPLVPNPLLDTYWPLAVARSREVDRLGLALAQARHQLEGQWGLQTLEVPQSLVCQTESFHWFTAHLLAHLPRLVEAYNTSVAHYRKARRIRTTAHPVPDLAADREWLEAPFWVWSEEDPTRRRLFVRSRGDDLLLTDRHRWETTLRLSADADADTAVAQLADLAAQGVKIRTRALVTTALARLLLSDLFIHGIGGAKYDQVTDAWVERFFGFAPPEFMAMSATQRLPVERPGTTIESLRENRQRLRELEFHPERFVTESYGALEMTDREAVQGWIEHKRRWIGTPQTRDNAKERYREIHRSNQALQAWTRDRESQLREQQLRLRDGLRCEALLGSRDYAFCLYSEEKLRPMLLDIFASGR